MRAFSAGAPRSDRAPKPCTDAAKNALRSIVGMLVSAGNRGKWGPLAAIVPRRNQKLIRPDNWITREFEEDVTRPKLVLVTVVFGVPNWAPLKAL